MQTGLITSVHDRRFLVLSQGTILGAQTKGKFRQADPLYRRPVIGDQVLFRPASPLAGEEQDAYIEEILPRKNFLGRLSPKDPRKTLIMAANLDLALVFVAADQRNNHQWLTPFLAFCHLNQLNAAIVVNKIDLEPAWQQDEAIPYFQSLGISVFGVSMHSGEGVDQLAEALPSGIVFLTGKSGVGKTSALNRLCQTNAATKTVQPGNREGRHATTHSSLHDFNPRTWIADSPGIRSFQPRFSDAHEIRFGFPEWQEVQKECRFPSCLHHREPGCAVKALLAQQRLPSWRYQGYVQLLTELCDS
jgi:ribosome biogenesis GTPase